MSPKGKILYVDDETDNLEFFTEILTADDFLVNTAKNSREAYAQLEQTPFDILLLDIGLANESGIDILKSVKSQVKFELMPVVMITGMLTKSNDLAYGLEMGADGYITRPVSKREFLARMNAFMRYKKTILALEKSEKQFKLILDKNPDAILVVEREGQVKYANPSAEKLFQLSVNDLLKHFFGYPLVIGEHAEINIVRKDSNELTGEMRTIDITWDENDALLTSIRDITDKRRLYDELILAKQRAEENDKLKSAFLANMSHEIRTPMNGILGFTELLKEKGLTGEQRDVFINMVEKSGHRMLNIINDIIDISRIEAGQMHLLISDFELFEQLDYLYNFFKIETKNKGIDLQLEFPSKYHQLFIRSDKEKINAIQTNLIKNAIKYSDKGHIRFGFTLENNTLTFFVKDTGSGIPASRLDAIFERFVQADIHDTRALQGAGLGLTISRAYVEMLGGKIWVESKEKEGSDFYFTIPHKPADQSFTYDDQTIFPETKTKKSLVAIIAEDDYASELLLDIAIEPFVKKSITVRTGPEVVKACRENPQTDLILMDIQLPVFDGLEATRQIRAFNQNVIIIAQTAKSLLGDKEKAIEAGCNDYISKPIKKSELESKIIKFFFNR